MKLIPREDNVIVRIIEPEEKLGRFYIPDAAKEASTLAEVIVPNLISYNRDGSKRKPYLQVGEKVRIPTGKTGTGVPEAPEGEKWLAIPEDCIYYSIS